MKTQVERLTRVRNAIYGQPWAITPEWLEAICEIFERNINAEKMDFETATKTGGGMGRMMDPGEYEVQNGVAIIPLMGPIFPRANMLTRMSGATSIAEFSQEFADALDNKDVSSILLQIDSPGGSVLGLNEAASAVFAARDQSKPVIALADGMAASAAYAVGSQAMEFYCTEGAIVGSIGVVMRIDSQERLLKNAGIDSTILKTGPLKAIGNGPITDAQMEKLRGMMDEYFTKFKDGVSRARAGIDIEAVSTGETWIGSKAVDMGLCDGISTMDAQLKRLAA